MLERNQDRGNKKWTAMMLTEHVELLRQWHDEDEFTERPELDEWELTLLAEEVERAHKGKSDVKLTHWKDGKLLDDYGTIINIDRSSKIIVLDDPFGTRRYEFDDITAISIID